MIVKIIGKKVLDFIFPRHCIICGRTNFRGKYEYLCDECEDEMKIIKGARCLTCGAIIGDDSMPDIHQCCACAGHDLKFGRSYTICSFDGAAREMLHALKYSCGTQYLEDMSHVAKCANGLGKFLNGALLVPVPIHWTRRIKRRYNQAELIAGMLIEAFPNLKLRKINLLKRRKKGFTQTTLDRKKRAQNIRKAFEVRESAISEIPEGTSRIVLIDDVMTTGATLSECAETLRNRGFAEVDAFAFAKRL